MINDLFTEQFKINGKRKILSPPPKDFNPYHTDNWENFSLRTRIVIICCRNKGVEPPPKDEIMKLLIKLEAE